MAPVLLRPQTLHFQPHKSSHPLLPASEFIIPVSPNYQEPFPVNIFHNTIHLFITVHLAWSQTREPVAQPRPQLWLQLFAYNPAELDAENLSAFGKGNDRVMLVLYVPTTSKGKEKVWDRLIWTIGIFLIQHLHRNTVELLLLPMSSYVMERKEPNHNHFQGNFQLLSILPLTNHALRDGYWSCLS